MLLAEQQPSEHLLKARELRVKLRSRLELMLQSAIGIAQEAKECMQAKAESFEMQYANECLSVQEMEE